MKKTSNSSARLSLAEVLRQNTGWRDAQTVYDTWRADKLHSTSLVERFYSDLAVLVEKGAVEVSEKKDDIGRKLGDRVQWRASGTSQS